MDQTQYLFLMKEMQVKSEFKIHRSVVFLDKNVDNLMNNKFLLSLGYDDHIEGDNVKTALVFKIWEFISLDSKCHFYFSDSVIQITSHVNKAIIP